MWVDGGLGPGMQIKGVVLRKMNNVSAALLAGALEARSALFDKKHEAALRLFNGFYEGDPTLVVDLYGKTIVLYDYADDPIGMQDRLRKVQEFLLARMAWVQAVVIKTRRASSAEARRGRVTYGTAVDGWIREHGVRYALDLLMNQDASFYLDTRQVRKWALDHLQRKTVLNIFAYTGSLGVAAMGGGATRVLHIDRNRRFLNLAKTSYTLNGYPIRKHDFLAGDFFPVIGRMRRLGERFDCVFLDPPFFSTTRGGTVDLGANSTRLINKVRPLINDGGTLLAINNALFLSGADYMHSLEALCRDGFLQIEDIIRVPEDITGYAETRIGEPPADPAPFNHPTKIALLRVRRKV